MINRIHGLNITLSVHDVLRKNFNPFESGNSIMEDNVNKDTNGIHFPEFCVIPDRPYWALNSKGKVHH